MTISNTSNRVEYTGDGSTTAFTVAFPFHAFADLIIIETNIATGAQVTKVITTDYTISGTVDDLGLYPNGGTVTAVVAPPTTVTWTIYRDVALTQSVDIIEGGPLPVESEIEAPLDRLTLIAQRTRELNTRTLRQPDGDATAVSTIPGKASRLSKYLSFDSAGNPIATSVDPPGGSFLTLPGVLLLSDYASLSAAVAAIGAVTPTTLLISASSTVAVNTTVTSNITLWFIGAGDLSVSATFTLTVNGSIFSSRILTDIFIGAGTTVYGSQVINIPISNAADVFTDDRTFGGRMIWSKGADIASAAALPPGTDGNYFDVTGTDAITSIADIKNGMVLKLHFDGALTLTHHATNLVLPGGVNIAIGAGDEVELFQYATGDWRLTNHSSNKSVAFLDESNIFTKDQNIRKATPFLTLRPTVDTQESGISWEESGGTEDARLWFDSSANKWHFRDVQASVNRLTIDMADGKMTAGTVPLARIATVKLDSSTAVGSNSSSSPSIQGTTNGHIFYDLSIRGSAGSQVHLGTSVSAAEAVNIAFHTSIARGSSGSDDLLWLINGTGSTITAVYKVYQKTET